MSIWEKMGFGGYKGFSHEADRLLRSAVELAGMGIDSIVMACSNMDAGWM